MFESAAFLDQMMICLQYECSEKIAIQIANLATDGSQLHQVDVDFFKFAQEISSKKGKVKSEQR
jgi:hypothetical protein